MNHQESRARQADGVALFLTGLTTTQIADKYGVSLAAVGLWLKKAGVSATDGGFAIVMKARVAERGTDKTCRKDARSLRNYGCSANELLALNSGLQSSTLGSAAHKYQQQKRAAKRRRIRFSISFPEWMAIWSESGAYELRGRGHGYVMARYGDAGAYEVGNVLICSALQNNSDGGKKSAQLRKASPKKYKSTAGRGKGWTISNGYIVARFNGKHLGSFTSTDEAAAAYKSAAANYLGSISA